MYRSLKHKEVYGNYELKQHIVNTFLPWGLRRSYVTPGLDKDERLIRTRTAQTYGIGFAGMSAGVYGFGKMLQKANNKAGKFGPTTLRLFSIIPLLYGVCFGVEAIMAAKWEETLARYFKIPGKHVRETWDRKGSRIIPEKNTEIMERNDQRND